MDSNLQRTPAAHSCLFPVHNPAIKCFAPASTWPLVPAISPLYFPPPPPQLSAASTAHADRDNVSLPGMAEHFRHESESERHHAQKLIDFQVCAGVGCST